MNSTVFEDIKLERGSRALLGHTKEMDDTRTDGSLVSMACCYALNYEPVKTDKRKSLVKAATLIVTEIERLDRAIGR